MTTQTTTNRAKLTQEQKDANKLLRQEARKQKKEFERVEREQNQKPVEKITISIEWKKSRMYGNNPTAEARIFHKDGSISYGVAKCSGYGYDKESTVVAQIFNNFLKYKLYGEFVPVERAREGGLPYGIYLGQYRHFSGGIGVNCYYDISKAIGGEFKHVASGKTFDVYEYTEQ
jgi:hypothetical protein